MDLAEAYREAEKNSKARTQTDTKYTMAEIREDAIGLMDALKTDELVISAVVQALKAGDPDKYGKLDHSRVRSAVIAGKIFELVDTDKGKGFRRLETKFPISLDKLPEDVKERVKDNAKELTEKASQKRKQEKEDEKSEQ
jgi:hypothetical protein